jgi:hypothetical protein
MRFGRLFRVQEGEGRLVALVGGATFVAAAAFAIGESGIDALFFDRERPGIALGVMHVLANRLAEDARRHGETYG